MALPQDGQNANGLTKVTEVPTGKELIFVDPTTNEGGIITLEDLTTQILKNLTSQTFALDQGNMTLLAALNQLNSKAGFSRYIGRRNDYDVENILEKNKGRILYFIVSNETATPFKYAVVETIIWDNGKECFQIAYSFATDDPSIQRRRYNGTNWSNWK